MLNAAKNRLQIEIFYTLYRHSHKYGTVWKQPPVSKSVLGIAGTVERLVSLRFVKKIKYWLGTEVPVLLTTAHDLGPYSQNILRLNVAHNLPI